MPAVAECNDATTAKAAPRADRKKPHPDLEPLLIDERAVMALTSASATGVTWMVRVGVLPAPIHVGGNRRLRRWSYAAVRAAIAAATQAGQQ